MQVEAELGTLAGIEDLGDSEHGETLTRPSDAERFARETGVDSLAVAVGTAHGAAKFRGEPRIDFARLEAIAELVPQPLVLHGASAIDAAEVARAEALGARLPGARGLPPELIRGAIERGVAKVNTDSDLRLAALTRLREVLAERPDLFNAYELMGEMERAIGETTECTAPGFLDTSLAVIMRPPRCAARAPRGRRLGCGGRAVRPATSGCSGP